MKSSSTVPWLNLHPYVIAEIGLNHNGDLDTALKMIDAAQACGVDAVKFQSFRAAGLLHPRSPRFETMQALELSDKDHRILREHSSDIGIHFISSAFCAEGLHLLSEIQVDAIKIASCDANNFSLIDQTIDTGLPFIASTGYSTHDEIVELVSRLSNAHSRAAILHCISAYPTQLHDISLANIPAIKRLVEQYPIPVGFSDHSIDTSVVPSVALALGASIFEKHFTLDSTRV
jgi:N,N'-diacetyllegionaminate synthase